MRIAEARRLVAEAGIDAPVRVMGVNDEIVVVTGPSALREPLAALAPELRALGYRYVALEPSDARRGPGYGDDA